MKTCEHVAAGEYLLGRCEKHQLGCCFDCLVIHVGECEEKKTREEMRARWASELEETNRVRRANDERIDQMARDGQIGSITFKQLFEQARKKKTNQE